MVKIRRKRAKGIVLILCTMLILVVPFVTAQAEETEKIRIGYVEPGNLMRDSESKNQKGYGYDILKKIEETSELEFELVPVTQQDPLDALKSGEVDAMGLYYKNEQRASEYLYSDIWYGKGHVSLTTKEKGLYYNDPQSLDGKVVSTYEGSYANETLEAYCIENEISLEFQYHPISEYMHADADLYLAYGDEIIPSGHHTVMNLGVYNLFLVSKYGNEAMMEKIDEAMWSVARTEGNFFLELEEQYFGGDIEINHRTIRRDEGEVLKQRPLQVGYLDAYNPISFTNERGEADGAMVDAMNYLAKEFGFEVEYHPWRIDDDIEELEQFDILISFYGDSEKYSEYFEMAESYHDVPMYAVTSQEVVDKGGTITNIISNAHKIGTLPYMAFEVDKFEENYPDNELVINNDWGVLLDEYAKGNLDLVLCTESATTYAEKYLEEIDPVTISIETEFPMQFMISKDIAGEYVPIFNVMQDNVSHSEYRAMLVSSSGNVYPETSLWDVIVDNWYYAVAVAGVALLGFFWYAYYEQKKKREILYTAYNIDVLTGVMTSPNFAIKVIESLKSAQPNEYEMISLDIDLFKSINSYFSLERGTEMIKALAKALQEGLKDTSAIIMRRTADQFLIFRKVDDGGTIKSIYNNIILPELKKIVGEKYKLSLSFGFYTVVDCSEKMSEIVGYADSARGQGKSVHKTTFIEFDQKMKKDYSNRLNVTFRMEQAIKDREFSVVYQPKIDFKTLQVGGAEALVRWFPRLGDVIYPDAFIPVFENNGFIAELDMYVLEEVCKFIRTNYRMLKIPRISVNLSAWTVLDPYITTRIMGITEKYGIPTRDLELEITESAIIGEETNFLNKVRGLKELGFIISIDDFGAGVSSLNRLSAIDADILKLDKAFFDLKDQGGKSTIVVEDVIKMAKHLDMQIVAEGVENYGQALWLKKLECEYAQGYYFERPLDEEKFKELLESKKVYTIS